MLDRRAVVSALLSAAALTARGATFAAQTPDRSTPLRVADDRLYLPAAINGVAVEGLLDSAAETSIVDAALAARLGLGGGQAVTARGTGAATAAATLVPGVALDVAGLRLRPEAIAVIDLADIARRLAHGPIALIVGRDLFDAARLSIAIDAGRLTVIDRATLPRGQRLPLTTRRGIEAVPVAIEGTPASADFDLGNGGTVLIGAAFAARHGLLDGRATGSIPGGGIGGATRQTIFTLRSLEVAGARFTDVPVAIDASPTASDANLGVRLLRRFDLVTDFAARGVWLDYRG